MKIRTKVVLSVISFCIITVVVADALFTTFGHVRDLNAREALAEKMLLEAHELCELFNDYLFFRAKIQEDLWIAKSDSMSALLAQMQAYLPEEQARVENVAANLKRLREVFDQVRATVRADPGHMGPGGDMGFLRLAWTRLKAQTHEIIAECSQLAQLIEEETRSVEYRTVILIIGMIAALIVFMTINYVFVNWRMLRSIATLQAGTAIIGSGNLDYRLEETGRDEIGDLTRSFNLMNADLKEVRAAKEELNREVAQRKLAEEAARRSEARYRDLVDNIEDLICTHDLEGNILFANSSSARLLGFAPAELVGTNLRSYLAPEVRDQFEAYLAAIRTDGRFSGLMLVLTKSGEKRIWEYRNTLHSENVAAPIVLGIARDVTERRRADQIVRESERRYRDLWEKAPVMMISLDINGRIGFASDHFCRELGYDRDEVLGRTPFEFQTEQSSRYAETVVFPAFLQTGSIRNAPLQYVKRNGEIMDVLLNVTAERDAQGNIVRSRSAFTDITDQKRAEDALRASENKFAKAFHASPDVFVISRLDDGLIIETNEKWESTFGYTREEVVGRTSLDLGIFPDPEDRSRLISILKQQGFVRDFELNVRNKAGEIRQTLVSGELIEINTQPCILTIVRDVTESKSAQRLLQQAEKRYRRLFEDAPLMYVITRNEQGVPIITDCNELFLRSLGYARGEVQGKPLADFYSPESHSDLLEGGGYARALSGEFIIGERQLLTHDGRLIPTLLYTATEVDPSGYVTGTRAMFVDVTQLKLMEAAQREIEVRYRGVFQNAAVGIDVVDDKGRFVEANSSLAEMLGYSEEELRNLTIFDLTHPEDLGDTRTRYHALLRGETDSYRFDKRFIRKDGEFVWTDVSVSAIRRPDGVHVATVGVITNITERKRSEEERRKSEEKLKSIFRAAPVGIGMVVDRVIKEANDHLCEMTGYSREELLDSNARLIYATEEDFEFVGREKYNQIAESGEGTVETRWRRKNGEVIDVLLSSSPIDPADMSAGITFTALDITQRNRSEEATRESERRYRSLFENMLEGYAYCRMFFENGEPQDFVYLDVNDAFERLTGLKNVIGRKVTEVIPGVRESNPELFEVYGSVAFTGKPMKLETYVPPLGIWFSISVYSTEREHFIAVFDNVTERKRTSEALKESEERFRILADGAFEGVVISRNGLILDSNKVFCEKSGYRLEELVGMSIGDLVPPEFKDIAMEHALSMSEGAYESAFIRKDGQVIPALVKGKTIPYEGAMARIASVRDISEAKKAEEVQRRLATAIEQSAEAVLITDAEGIIQYANPALERTSGFGREELVGQTPRLFKSGEHDQTFYRHLWNTIKAGNIWSGRLINRKKDGRPYYEDATISPVKDAWGGIVSFVAVKRDITEHLELSRQLLQAQKMEAIGTLAGGVAHDFNNILQVAVGYSELILSDEEFPPRFKADLLKIHDSATRGADLVQRLLTFSRKTEVKPLPLNLNRRINDLLKMLERTVPKMIEIQLFLAKDLAAINADGTQMDQVLMNLAVNARDAMPDGGRLVFETENVILDEEYATSHLDTSPGRYVLLTVRDTGTGMDQGTVEHIFEPFYTTKETGKGTGLGLAMVYGIVAQHGGHIKCCSEQGKGTTFEIYFPALVSDEEQKRTPVTLILRGGSETILIVDDDEVIRDLGSRILTKAGYNVITATNGKEALELYRLRGDEISLVILDLIMPTMGGTQCLDGLLSLNPSVKVVIASGYSGESIPKDALASKTKAFVKKPYDIGQVLEVVRETLDSD